LPETDRRLGLLDVAPRHVIVNVFDSALRRAKAACRPNRVSVLTGGGERVDIDLTRPLRERTLDVYQLSHLRRYQFAASRIEVRGSVADLACGTGYGSVLLAEPSMHVLGADRDSRAVGAAAARYRDQTNVSFRVLDLLDFNAVGTFDTIVSFETLEHFRESDLLEVLRRFHRALTTRGRLIFSTPYRQEDSDAAKALGFHQTFLIDEERIENWLTATRFRPQEYYYQSYGDHEVVPRLDVRDFVICVAEKN
jgi:2-polyprenyl-3-methyl-5-hydroxy-6-metoxy-1,4-benzoquinol methylase